MIWGVGIAPTETNAIDPRYGSLIGQDVGGYLIPADADIVELLHVPGRGRQQGQPHGHQGVGELGISGAGAAIANAIYNACGVRLRDYPMTPDKVLAGLVAKGL